VTGRPDVKDVSHRRLVIPQTGKGPPHSELIDLTRAGIRIAADKIDVEVLEIRRREHLAGDDGVAQVRNLLAHENMALWCRYYSERGQFRPARSRGGSERAISFQADAA
jgi:hypothetical protein